VEVVGSSPTQRAKHINNSMLTIDYLKRHAFKKPHYMGVGFIKVKTKEGVYRFYCEEVAKQTIDRVHSHNFSFKSRILKGVLTNVIYDIVVVDYETNHRLIECACRQGAQSVTLHENIETPETARFNIAPGGSYWIEGKTMHRIEYGTQKVITFKTESVPSEHMGRYAEDKITPIPDPWGAPKTVKQCWDAIEYILTDD
jgi:hypothetical protein